jgi:hypothetical protein
MPTPEYEELRCVIDILLDLIEPFFAGFEIVVPINRSLNGLLHGTTQQLHRRADNSLILSPERNNK